MAPSPTTSSIRVTHRTERSFASTILQGTLRLCRGYLISIPTVARGSIKLSPPSLSRCQVEVREICNIHIYDISLKEPSKPECRRRIYYIAGGSWQMPPGRQHWMTGAQLVQDLEDTEFSIVSVPLAQHTPAPKAWPQLLEVYEELMKLSATAGEKVIWAGDSSGGNLVLCLTIDALKTFPQVKAPDAVLAICPSIDLTRDNPQIQVVDSDEPILTMASIQQSAKAWAGEWNRKDPRLSPIFADLTMLKEKGVKVHGVTAGYDLLGPDGLLFRQKCQDVGVEGEWLEWDKQMHVFPLTWMFLHEGKEGLHWIVDVLARV
ncbi:alpha/beta hydrolase fold-domain-containing protein [Crepidotus variabilis]|uniref:Alpha/beta hydrolase fold-domain-containing protein n=1 Tax=Crepidotus variabilis TaxID=179855 RepID=A0A9P6ESW3_9AGAR|nr:alpha/beta hydrolase fold-domain-containing protein [Crepidotus variabilis]